MCGVGTLPFKRSSVLKAKTKHQTIICVLNSASSCASSCLILDLGYSCGIATAHIFSNEVPVFYNVSN